MSDLSSAGTEFIARCYICTKTQIPKPYCSTCDNHSIFWILTLNKSFEFSCAACLDTQTGSRLCPTCFNYSFVLHFETWAEGIRDVRTKIKFSNFLRENMEDYRVDK